MRKANPPAQTRKTAAGNKQVERAPRDYNHIADPAMEFPTADEILKLGRQLGDEGITHAAIGYARRQLVLGFMVAGIPRAMILAQCAREYGMNRNMVDNIMIEVRKAWRTEWEEATHYAKAEAIQRLRRDLAHMRQQPNRSWKDIRGHEALLAKIEGTEAPVRVAIVDANVEMRDAIVGVLGSMTPDDMQAYVTEGYDVELKQLAAPKAQAAE